MHSLATVLVALLLAVSAISVELFRYRYSGEDGGQYEAGAANLSEEQISQWIHYHPIEHKSYSRALWDDNVFGLSLPSYIASGFFPRSSSSLISFGRRNPLLRRI
jgi:hypothetical protein